MSRLFVNCAIVTYMYKYIYIYIYIYIYVYVCVCVCMYMRVYVHVCVYMCAHVCIMANWTRPLGVAQLNIMLTTLVIILWLMYNINLLHNTTDIYNILSIYHINIMKFNQYVYKQYMNILFNLRTYFYNNRHTS